jgi:hypothetical protein
VARQNLEVDMHRRTRKLSIDDQKAVDVILDHGATGGKPGLTRMAAPAHHRRVAAASKVLSLLAELPEIEPPADLISRTMAMIDQHATGQIRQQPATSISTPKNMH